MRVKNHFVVKYKITRPLTFYDVIFIVNCIERKDLLASCKEGLRVTHQQNNIKVLYIFSWIG